MTYSAAILGALLGIGCCRYHETCCHIVSAHIVVVEVVANVRRHIYLSLHHFVFPTCQPESACIQQINKGCVSPVQTIFMLTEAPQF